MEHRTVGIVMNGVTGRMGTNQHLIRSILAIRADGGLPISGGRVLWPEPILVGRNEAKVAALAKTHGLDRWTTDLNAALNDSAAEIYFDAQLTNLRAPAVEAAIAAGMHIYVEKPTAEDTASATRLAQLADAAGVKHGVVQDKLFLPGLRKLKRLVESGFFGRILSARGLHGYWVFEGGWHPSQRPSWNYRKADGGSVILDMFPHWRYVLDHVLGPVRALTCVAANHITERFDERNEPYHADADDAAYAIFELEGGIIVPFTTSWVSRVRRDELLELHVDGTHGSAVAGLWDCVSQHRTQTPMPVWNPDVPPEHDFRADWVDVPANARFDNGFRVQWEQFLRHVADDAPFTWTLDEGAKGVQLAELAMQSWQEGRRVEVPPLPR